MLPSMLASIVDPGYKIALFLHILAVVVAFGPTFAYALFSTVSQKHPRATPALLEGIRRTDRYLVTPGMVVLLIAGVYLLADGDWDASEAFISVGFVAIFLLFGLQMTFFTPQARRARQIAERDLKAGDELSEEYVAVAQRIGKVGSFAGLVVVVAIFFMTYKPFL
jgi:uncharacterized membrane protein